MNKKYGLWLSILFFVTACSQSGNQPTVTPEQQLTEPPIPTVGILPTFTPACISPEPSQDDIDRALNFAGQLFEQDDWERSYTVTEDRVTVSWFSSSFASVAFLETLIFPCGYEEPDLNEYFSDESWSIVFGNYESYEYVAECRSDRGLRLYQFNVVSDGALYLVHYWVQNDTNTRVLTFMMVVPDGSFELIDGYGYSLFPQLSNCS